MLEVKVENGTGIRAAWARPRRLIRLRNVIPGTYKLFAWDAIQPTAWTKAQFLKPCEDRGVALTVKQAENSEVAIREF